MKPRPWLLISLVLLLGQLFSLHTHRALAAAGCNPAKEHCVAVGEWSIQLAAGAGMRTNPLVNSSDIPLLVIPQVSYYGERFFIDYLDLGFTLASGPQYMLNAVVTPGKDGIFFQRDLGRWILEGGTSLNASPPKVRPGSATDGPAQDSSVDEPVPDLHKRRIAGMAGLEASASLGPAEWQVQVLQDVISVHHGQEVRFAAASSTQRWGHEFGVTLGASWKSEKLANYYYGVSPSEAHKVRPAYKPQSGFTPLARLNWNKPINQHWRLVGSLQYEHLNEAMRRSPLVEDNKILQVFIGGVYHF